MKPFSGKELADLLYPTLRHWLQLMKQEGRVWQHILHMGHLCNAPSSAHKILVYNNGYTTTIIERDHLQVGIEGRRYYYMDELDHHYDEIGDRTY